MINFDNNQIIIIIVMMSFVISAFQRQLFHWLWFSVAIWLCVGIFSAHILPNVLGITHWANAYLLHGYLFIGSIFFWLNHVFRLTPQPKDKHSYWRGETGIFLTLLALANLVMHMAFAILCVLIAWEYPNGLTAWLPPALLQLYVWQPIAWWLMTAWLMVIFLLHRRIQKKSADVFSLPQIYAGLLLAMLMQVAYIVHSFNV